MGIEIALVYLGLAIAGVFTVNKGVELIKHESTVESDKYSSCISATKEASQCRGLE